MVFPGARSEYSTNANVGLTWTPERRGRETAGAINALLDHPNPQPVGITYCVNFIHDNPGFPGIMSGFSNRRACEPHASLVIGRRLAADGSCELLLRNSWGADWCPTTGKAICDDRQKGQVWVNSEYLGKMTFGISTLDSPQ